MLGFRRMPLALIVAEPGDRTADAVATTLARPAAALQPMQLTPADLACGRWHHHVSAAGRPETAFCGNAGVWRDDEIGVAWYRAASMYAPAFAGASTQDQVYAVTELTALVVSWLHGLRDRAVNQPSGANAIGPPWTAARWLDEARRAGLRVAPGLAVTSARMASGWRGSPYDAKMPWRTADRIDASLLVAGNRVVGDATESNRRAMLGLARRAGCRFLRFNMTTTDGQAAFVSADPMGACLTPEEVEAAGSMLVSIANRTAVDMVPS